MGEGSADDMSAEQVEYGESAEIDVREWTPDEQGRQLAELAAWGDQRLREGVEAGVEHGYDKARAERERKLQENVASYREGIAEDNPCGAPSGVMLAGVEVLCGLPAGHPIGAYERHKAVFGEPHLAVVWNELEGE